MIGTGFLLCCLLLYCIDIAAHRSALDLCHHHAMFVKRIIKSYSAFFLTALLGLAATPAATVAGFFEAALFNLALIAFLFLETPNEPL